MERSGFGHAVDAVVKIFDKNVQGVQAVKAIDKDGAVVLHISNRIDEKALDVLEAIVEANEINPAIETDPQRRAKLCMVRFDLQTSALTGCKMLLIFLDIAKTHGQIDNRACEFWTKRVLDVKYMTAAWRKKDAARFR